MKINSTIPLNPAVHVVTQPWSRSYGAVVLCSYDLDTFVSTVDEDLNRLKTMLQTTSPAHIDQVICGDPPPPPSVVG